MKFTISIERHATDFLALKEHGCVCRCAIGEYLHAAGVPDEALIGQSGEDIEGSEAAAFLAAIPEEARWCFNVIDDLSGLEVHISDEAGPIVRANDNGKLDEVVDLFAARGIEVEVVD